MPLSLTTSMCQVALLLLSYYCHFSQLCLVIEVSLAQTVLDGQNLIFLEGEGELSMPICFKIYVFSL